MTYKRKEVIGDCTLYLGDCMEVMPTLGQFDALVTDPPYGIRQAEGFPRAGGFYKPIARREYIGDWDNQRPEKIVFDVMRGASRWQVIWGGQYFADMLPAQGRWLWWDKCQTMPTYGDGELAWTNLNAKAPKKFVYSNNGLMAKEKGRVHPTQKPVAVMEWSIGWLADKESILDPFMGSGTTGVACVNLGRQFTGIELKPKYFDIACKRIEEAYKQPRLFEEPAPKKAEQIGFDLETK